MNALDLNQRPPRSPRTRLGGYALLPRLLDKCRAEIAGTAGPFKYACPNDQYLFDFLGISPEALKNFVSSGAGDGAVLEWIRSSQTQKRTSQEISEWSQKTDQRAPDLDSQGIFDRSLAECAPGRTDITCWSDLLDLDDYVSYGGKP